MKMFNHNKRFLVVIITFFAIAFCGLINLNQQNAYAADSDIVNIPDENFKKLLNIELGVSDTSADITKGQLKNIKNLNIIVESIVDVTGIQYCTNLSVLSLQQCYNLTDISPIGKLTKLEQLTLTYVYEKTDISSISKLTNLKYLNLNGTKVSDISILKNFTNLEFLVLSGTEVSDISVLKNLTNLWKLDISNTNVTDITPIQELNNLLVLNISGIKINKENESNYIATISSLVDLQALTIENCDITDEHTVMFTTLDNLILFKFSYNYINDFTFLVNMPIMYLENNYYYSSTSENVQLITTATELRVKNTVKDFFGNYVIPRIKDNNGNIVNANVSSLYTYDTNTNEIIINISKLGKTDDFELIYLTKNNINKVAWFDLELYKEINIKYYKPLEATLATDSLNGRKWYVGDLITLQALTTNGSGNFSYKYYLVNHSTNTTTLISKYDKSGSYTYLIGKDIYGKTSFYAEITDIDGRVVKTNNVDINVFNHIFHVNGTESSAGRLNLYEGDTLKLYAFNLSSYINCEYKFESLNLTTGKRTLLRDFNTENQF